VSASELAHCNVQSAGFGHNCGKSTVVSHAQLITVRLAGAAATMSASGLLLLRHVACVHQSELLLL